MNRMLLKQFLFFSLIVISFSATVGAKENGNNPIQKQTDGKNSITELNETDTPLDLKWLIQEALEHNPEIIASHKRINAAKAKTLFTGEIVG